MKRGDVVRAITEQLKINGMMTLADLCAVIGKDKNYLQPVLARMGKPTTRPMLPKRVYIAEYVFDQEGMRKYPRPLYALGPYPDAVKPERDVKQIKREYRARKRMKQTTNSVFNLGANQRGQVQIHF